MSPATKVGVRADVDRLLAGQASTGAFPAGAGFSQYGQSWLRDGAFISHALDLAGEFGAAAAFHAWVASCLLPLSGHVERLISDRAAGAPLSEFDFLPARFDVNGKWVRDGWPNFQLDGYGQWLWSLASHVRSGGPDVTPDVRATAALVVRYLGGFWNEPCYDSWEEYRSQLHTATLGSILAGLRDIGLALPELRLTATPIAEDVERFLFQECVENGAFVKHVRNPAVDASLLWLATPFNIVSVHDPRMMKTVDLIKEGLLGGGIRRYAADTYYGGGEWVLLTAWLAWHLQRAGKGNDAERLMVWVEQQRDSTGGLPEQVPGENPHPYFLQHWTNTWGPSASPLLWSHAMVVCTRLG